MIIVKLMGGLGNQLFQYAAAKTLALKHNTDLKLDVSFLEATHENVHTKRELELHYFQTNFHKASSDDLQLFNTRTFFKRMVNKYFPFHSGNFYYAKEKGFEYDQRFKLFPQNTYLEGFWQSEKYFGQIRSVLLKELVLKEKATERINDLTKQILNANSVSIHIRRGDYITNKNASEFHGNLSMEYYYEALSIIIKRIAKPRIFVFSDDMEWVKMNFKTEHECVFVDFNAAQSSVWDLYLMSLCKHNIIANSSFSWWGAWLNQHQDKTVIAPKQWFANKSLNTQDLLPDTWIKL